MLGLLFITSSSANRVGNVFLGLSLWSLAFEVLGVLSDAFSKELIFIPHTSLFTIPFLLLYINKTINSNIKLGHYALFIPGIIINLIILGSTGSRLLGYLEYIFNITLLLYSLNIIRRHNIQVNNFYSNLEHKTLQWIKTIVFIYLGFHLLWIVEDIVGLQNENLVEYFAELSTILTLFMVYWIGYNGFSQHETFKQNLFGNHAGTDFKESIAKDITISNTSGNVISEEDMIIFENIYRRIRSEKLYTNPKLDLKTLSDDLQLNSKEVSRLINQQTKANFYQFINEFRVSEFKELLQSPKARQYSILGLAENAGFNSKSTFYTAFKTLEGITPKQYEKSLKKSE